MLPVSSKHLEKASTPQSLAGESWLLFFTQNLLVELDLFYGVSSLSPKSLARLLTATTSVQEVCARKILQNKHCRTFWSCLGVPNLDMLEYSWASLCIVEIQQCLVKLSNNMFLQRIECQQKYSEEPGVLAECVSNLFELWKLLLSIHENAYRNHVSINVRGSMVFKGIFKWFWITMQHSPKLPRLL